MDVAEYRAKHKRCRMCKYAKQYTYHWECLAKNKSFRHRWELGKTTLCGMFCKIYTPRED